MRHFFLLFLLFFAWSWAEDLPDLRKKADKCKKDRNYKEALTLWKSALEHPQAGGEKTGEDLVHAVECLSRLNHIKDADVLLESNAQRFAKDWRVLKKIALQYVYISGNYGVIIAGKFERGQHRGGGDWVDSFTRDRARSLQLFAQALPLAEADANTTDAGNFCSTFAENLERQTSAFHMQRLTDLSTLPDWTDPRPGDSSLAPTNAHGDPLFFSAPSAWNLAKNDGERWRWLLDRAAQLNPTLVTTSTLARANWAAKYYDVQTLQYGPYGDRFTKEKEGPWSFFTLKENETLARLASGLKRFTLPDDYAFLPIWRTYNNWTQAAQSLENRTQYEAAAVCWEKAGSNYADRVNQIRGNWGSFTGSQPQVAGKGATLDFRFRNGAKASFTAWKVLDDKLREDIKAKIRSKPSKWDNYWQETNPSNIGWNLVEKNESKYRGEQVAKWDLDLEPAKDHFTKVITVQTPLQKAGCYLVESQMADGNQSRTLVWISDAILVEKNIEGGRCYFLLDATKGTPIANATISFFAWKSENDGKTLKIDTKELAETTDADGIAILKPEGLADYSWQILAEAQAPDGRRAWLGFNQYYTNNRNDSLYDQTKAFIVTDRPVYRPGHKVQGKFWVRQAKYEQGNKDPWAGKSVTLRLHDPKGSDLWNKSLTTDNNGGCEFSWEIPVEGTLGNYTLYVDGLGSQSFRVEEYKKPEFEVSVIAPEKPLALGATLSAIVKAKYYFGAPVSDATVKITVNRTTHNGDWYPSFRWDWLYGNGYWWFCDEYPWYPGWSHWGCRKPQPHWYQGWWRQQDPPEMVLERECAIGSDGTVKIDIDTASAKALFGDRDHSYHISAEITDKSRRTIVGSGNVIAARAPYKVIVWGDHGYLRQGETIGVSVAARTPDGKPVAGKATVSLLKISYDSDRLAHEKEVAKEVLTLNADGQVQHKFVAGTAGQYRISAVVVDTQNQSQEGGTLLTVLGAGTSEYRFNALEITSNQADYQPGQKAQLLIASDQPDSAVFVFPKPVNGICTKPVLQRLTGRTGIYELPLTIADQPNCFVEVMTVANGKVHTAVREIIIPPSSRMLTVELVPDKTNLRPGQTTTLTVKVRDEAGRPFTGDAAMTVYDKSVEYISGGSNVPDIHAHFWKWRRYHSPQTIASLLSGWPILRSGERGMDFLGIFGAAVEMVDSDGWASMNGPKGRMGAGRFGGIGGGGRAEACSVSAEMAVPCVAPMKSISDAKDITVSTEAPTPNDPPPQTAVTIRKNFADTALWRGTIKLDANGQANIECPLPESLTTWKAKLWAVGDGARVGEASAEIITSKDLMVRLQAPRFFVERDEVVISGNIHSMLDQPMTVTASLELSGGLVGVETKSQQITLLPKGESRVDWRVKATTESEAILVVKALSKADSDAMELRLPIKVHGMVKMLSVSRSLRPEESSSSFTLEVPKERRPDQTRLEVRWSPTLAGAMMDALPYLVSYPYGCTEQTLNRFLPTVVVQKLLSDQGIDLEKLSEKHTNLNAQEIGDPAKRAAQWKIWKESNPIYDPAKVRAMVKEGISHLAGMQCSDGGWGWNSGYGEHSYPHTTAVVVHGLTIAKASKVALPAGLLERGVAWLEKEQARQVKLLENGRMIPDKTRIDRPIPYKDHADAQDAFTAMVLAENGKKDDRMLKFLDEDRTHLSVYGVAMYGLTMHHLKDKDGVARALRNVEQYLKQDEENQTAWLELGNSGYWWYWYGSENETLAIYLKLLAATDPKGKVAPRLVKYLLNNRKHGARWDSTRDTAMCIESLGDYLRASGEIAPDLTVTASVDGKKWKEVKITKENLLTFDGTLVLEGALLGAGKHTVELSKTGSGPLYANAYLSFFTLEDTITAAGLEVKVERKLSRLEKVDLTTVAAGDHGQVVEYATEKYRRVPLPDGAKVKSCDLIEVELIVESKNDYEYICLEDYKPAGCESADLQSGYVTGTGIHAYRELRDDRVAHLIHRLPRGKHNIIHRLRAEIPGTFAVLPTKIYGMYAPELVGNSDSQKLEIGEK